MITTGITGTIAAGKTSVSILLKRHGFAVFNCDNYAKIALHKGSGCYAALVELLTEDVVSDSGDIDPKKMAAVIFHDEEKRKGVNAIVHPFVREAMHHFFESHAQEQLVFAEVPLLFEAGWEDDFDQICVVTCTKETAVSRMRRDRGYSEAEALARYDSQINIEEQKKKADFVINNDGDLKKLNDDVNAWLRELRREARTCS